MLRFGLGNIPFNPRNHRYSNDDVDGADGDVTDALVDTLLVVWFGTRKVVLVLLTVTRIIKLFFLDPEL